MLPHPRHVAAEFRGDVPFSLMVGNALLIQSARVIRIQMCNLKLLRAKVSTHAAMKLIATGLGNDLHDAARGLAVLRFESAGLHLDFLNEVERRGVAELSAARVARGVRALGDALVADFRHLLRHL